MPGKKEKHSLNEASKLCDVLELFDEDFTEK